MKKNVTEFLKSRLLEPLGITSLTCALLGDGTELGGGGMKMVTEDMAKFMCGVELAVAELYRCLDGAVKILVDGNLPRPEADGRHLDVVGEHGRFGKRLSRCH